jgi:DNA-binding CsgD family transcriptional regulator
LAANSAIPSAIEACCDAAFEFKRWPDALQKLADALGASSCVIRTRDPAHPFRLDQRRPTAARPDSREHAEFAALWIERVENAPDPHHKRAAQLARPPVTFIVEDEITTPEERRRLPYYQEIAVPGHRAWWGAVGFKVRNRTWGLQVYRDEPGGRFDLSEADRFLSVAPHLSRIISMAEKVWETSIGASLAALDHFGCPAALLDCRGRVTRINQHAEMLLASDLAIRHGHFHATDRASDVRLQGLVRATASILPDGSAGSGPVVIARNGSPWLLAEAVPMTSFAHDLFNGGDVLLYFTDLEAGAAPDEGLLGRAFRLTEAEARLASSLAAGDGIDAASDRLAISRETARTQLRAVFAKTGTHRQAELVALLSRLRQRSRR